MRTYRLPHRTEPFVFGFLLSGLMSLLVSGIAMLRALGFVDHFLAIWASAWISSWIIAFPSVLIVAPLVRRMVVHLVARPPASWPSSGVDPHQ